MKNLEILDTVCKLELSNKYETRSTLFDIETMPKVMSKKWYLDKNGYAVARGERRGTSIRMHRFLTDAKKGQEIDHINRDKLDNRLSNLRFVTHQENCLNRALGKPHRDKQRNLWKARVKINQREVFLGRYKTYEEAEIVLKEAHIKYFGAMQEISNLVS